MGRSIEPCSIWYRTMYDNRTSFDSAAGGTKMSATALGAPQAVSTRTYASLRAAAIPLFALCLALFVEMVDSTLLTRADRPPSCGRAHRRGHGAHHQLAGLQAVR